MAVTMNPITVEIDIEAGVSIGRTPSGYEVWRSPLPQSFMDAWREMQRVRLAWEIHTRCAGNRRRQMRRARQ